jgi:phage/plasmid-associated DNA primase
LRELGQFKQLYLTKIKFIYKTFFSSKELTGSTSEQCLFILIREGVNGKSTFVNVINKLLSDYLKAASSETVVPKGASESLLKHCGSVAHR